MEWLHLGVVEAQCPSWRPIGPRRAHEKSVAAEPGHLIYLDLRRSPQLRIPRRSNCPSRSTPDKSAMDSSDSRKRRISGVARRRCTRHGSRSARDSDSGAREESWTQHPCCRQAGKTDYLTPAAWGLRYYWVAENGSAFRDCFLMDVW